MSNPDLLPRLLVIDDTLGRRLPDRPNPEREMFCGQFLIEDASEGTSSSGQRIKAPIAKAVFLRGQAPVSAVERDTVENDLTSIVNAVRAGWDEPPRWSLVLLDLCFYTGIVNGGSVSTRGPGMPVGREGDASPSSYFGLTVLQHLRGLFPELPIIMLSGQSRREVSRQYSVLGALGFLERDAQRGAGQLREYIDSHGLISDPTGGIVGHSRDLLFALRAARRLARSGKNLLFRGERGTGKELISEYVHRQRPDPTAAPFVRVNSPVLNNELFASELFGIEASVATGVNKRTGLIQEANGGDLFFDEIGEMIPQAQAAIRGVLEYGVLTTQGGKKPIPVNTRFLSATNADIEAFAYAGTFLPDLLDRLRQGGTIFLPPLRHRKEDIPLLVSRLVRSAEASIPGAVEREIETDSIAKLKQYDWPGNIRELQQVIGQAVANNLHVEHFAPIHIHFQSAGTRDLAPSAILPPTKSQVRSVGIESILADIREFSFDGLQMKDLEGRLDDIEEAMALFLAGYIRAALAGNPKRNDPQVPYYIEPSFKWIGGDAYSATKAYDYVKWLFDISKRASAALHNDPVLAWAHSTSLTKRPKKPRKNLAESEARG